MSLNPDAKILDGMKVDKNGLGRSIVIFDDNGKGDKVDYRWDGSLVYDPILNDQDKNLGYIAVKVSDGNSNLVFVEDDELESVINFIRAMRGY